MQWEHNTQGFDESFTPDGEIRDQYAQIIKALDQLGPEELTRREQMQQVSLVNQGITFTVSSYSTLEA